MPAAGFVAAAAANVENDVKSPHALLAGPLAAFVFCLALALLPLWIPGYSQVRQTVSEIGMFGSPMHVPFTILLSVGAVCVLVFGLAIRGAALRAGHSSLAGWLTVCMAISAAGVAVFAYPAGPHNYFGLSELIGYQAPLALAITWRRDARARGLVRLSSLLAVLMYLAIVANLATLDRGGSVFAYERPFYGLVQRSLFVVFFVWCAAVGAMLFAIERRRLTADSAPAAAAL